jgi:hypothetical protein
MFIPTLTTTPNPERTNQNLCTRVTTTYTENIFATLDSPTKNTRPTLTILCLCRSDKETYVRIVLTRHPSLQHSSHPLRGGVATGPRGVVRATWRAQASHTTTPSAAEQGTVGTSKGPSFPILLLLRMCLASTRELEEVLRLSASRTNNY